MTHPAWLQQPGEADDDYCRRQINNYRAWAAERRAAGCPVHDIDQPLTVDCAAGVGTLGMDGLPSGSGWR